MNFVEWQAISRKDSISRKTVNPKIAAVERAIAHVKYIQHRPGPDRAEGGRDLFDSENDRINPKAFRKKIREMENKNVVVHKYILSPEVPPADKMSYTREVMEKIGSEKGQDLEWIAVAHGNTAHPHIHVVVLGVDKHGKDVRFEMADHDKIREFSDRYTERCHPVEFEIARRDRERKEMERKHLKEKERERKAKDRADAKEIRIRDGIELPWLHRQVVREMLEPYTEWREKRDKAGEDGSGREGKPGTQNSIEAAGKSWTKENTLAELDGLNKHLWRHREDWIERDEYIKLVAWIKEKEWSEISGRSASSYAGSAQAPLSAADSKGGKETNEKSKERFEWKGETYSKDDSYEKLAALSKQLWEEKDKNKRLPIDDYQKLQIWIEDRDRQRFSGFVAKHIEETKQKWAEEGAEAMSPHNHRYVDPALKEFFGNPVVGLFMKVASVARTLVGMVDLKDNRDRLKEAGDNLEAHKLDKQEEYLKRESPEARARDEAVIEKLDQAIDENKEARAQRDKKRKRRKQERDHGEDPFLFDPWGRY